MKHSKPCAFCAKALANSARLGWVSTMAWMSARSVASLPLCSKWISWGSIFMPCLLWCRLGESFPFYLQTGLPFPPLLPSRAGRFLPRWVRGSGVFYSLMAGVWGLSTPPRKTRPVGFV